MPGRDTAPGFLLWDFRPPPGGQQFWRNEPTLRKCNNGQNGTAVDVTGQPGRPDDVLYLPIFNSV